MAFMTYGSRSLHLALGVALAAQCGAAAAIDFQIGENTLKFENLLTIGVSFRMQDRDHSLIGKSSLHRLNNPITSEGQPPGLCYTRAEDNGIDGPDPALDNNDLDSGTYTSGVILNACSFSSQGPAFAAAPGSFVPNGDNGNLSFDKGDIVHAIAKITSDISFSFADYNFFIRPIVYFDANYMDFEETHPDTTLRPRHLDLPDAVEEQVGFDYALLDYNVSHLFSIGDRDLSVKLGNQVLNWGESSFLPFNSLNTINPLDATKLRFPGADLKEFFQPVGMLVMGTDLFDNVSLEGFYQYDWRPLRIDPVGTFFSQSDTLGAGGSHAMLGFGKNPDDPEGIYEALDTCSGPGMCVDTAGLLGSTSSRTIYRDFAEEERRKPDDTGQYGVALKTFLAGFNNGTEVGFYFANYHSRLPIASFISAVETCMGQTNSSQPALDLQPAPLGACDVVPGGTMAAGVEPVPVDTVKIVIEYPEDIRVYGMSFNTTIGDYALSGEYAFRDNLPVQIHTTDLTFAALNPSLPESEIPNLLPSRRQAFPDFVSLYRGIVGGYGPETYIRGYESMKSGQTNLTLLRLIGGDNPIAASQMTFLFEMGMNKTFDMPSLSQLQFQGGGVDTHISDASDGTRGINPDDPEVDQDGVAFVRRQNVTAHKDLKGFGTSESYGYRLLNLSRWDSAFFGANIETLTLLQHDVKGTTPGIGTNFVHGRKQIAFGVRFDYLSTWIGEVRYSWATGGAKRDGLRDRDNAFVSLGYQF